MRVLKLFYYQAVLHTSPVGDRVSSYASSADLQLRQRFRYSTINWLGKSKCMECSFKLTEKGALGIGSTMQWSSRLLTKGMHTAVYVSGKESKEKVVLTSKKRVITFDLENDRQAMAFTINWLGKSKCMECSFKLTEKGALGIGNTMQRSSRLFTKGMHTAVYVSVKESKEKVVLASKKRVITPDLENDRQAMALEKLPERGLTKVGKAAQEQGGLQKFILYPDVGTNPDGAGLIDISDSDEHSDIFDDLFDSDDAKSSKNEQNKFKKCSLSDLVRQHIKAFSVSKKEREAATRADDYKPKGERSSSQKSYKPDDLDVSTKHKHYRAEQVDSFLEEEDRSMLSHRSGGGGPRVCSSMGVTQDHSYNYKAGMGGKYASGRLIGGDMPRSKCRLHANRDGHSDAKCEEDGKHSSAKVYGNERPRYAESKARGGFADEHRRRGSKAEQGGGLEGTRRYEGRARW